MSRLVASTPSLVFAPRTTSSNLITFAGLKKCRPITLSGRFVTSAISFTSRVLVFVARIAPGLATASSLVKMSFFTSMFSNTASMIRSASFRSPMSSEGVSSAMRFSTSSCVMRPFFAVFS